MPKIWTANDVEITRIFLDPPDENGDVLAQANWHYLDPLGVVIPDIATAPHGESVAWGDIPADIQAALVNIRDWLKGRIIVANEVNIL